MLRERVDEMIWEGERGAIANGSLQSTRCLQISPLAAHRFISKASTRRKMYKPWASNFGTFRPTPDQRRRDDPGRRRTAPTDGRRRGGPRRGKGKGEHKHIELQRPSLTIVPGLRAQDKHRKQHHTRNRSAARAMACNGSHAVLRELLCIRPRMLRNRKNS